MRRPLLAVLAAALLLGTAVPASAHPTVPLEDTDPTGVASASTDNVEHHGRFPEHAGTAGGRLSDDGELFYVTDPRGVYVYDVAQPRSPALLGSLNLYQQDTGAALAQEDPDTNGEILLVDGATTPAGLKQLHVVDVSDPTELDVLSTVDVTDHTWTCVSEAPARGLAKPKNEKRQGEPAPPHGPNAEDLNRCAYAYGRTGHIVDLTDPAEPRLVPDTWRSAVDYWDDTNTPYTHDLTEIRPGLVMSAGADAILMDTADPAAPVRLAEVVGNEVEEGEDERFSSLGYHSVEWANDGRAPYVVLGTEIAPNGPTNLAGSDCEGDNSVIETWDAREILDALKAYEDGAAVEEAFAGAAFTKVDTFDAGGRGLFLDGQSPGHVLYCAHWMDLHPAFDTGGQMAVSYYDRGTRFVDVDADGGMNENGWFVAADSYSGSPRWVTDTVVYIMDYRRGLEVVEVTGDATDADPHLPDDIPLASSLAPHTPFRAGLTPYLSLGAFSIMLVGAELHRRRRRTGASGRNSPRGGER